MISISLDPNGDTCTARLTEFLGPEVFQKFRDSCYEVGARFIPSERANRLPLDGLPQFLQLLDQKNLAAEVDGAIAAILGDRADEAAAMLEEGRARLAASDARLAGTGLSPFAYQRTGVEWLAPRTGALLTDEMGLGKTIQGLLAAPDSGGVMVICPKGVRASWERETRLWRPDLKMVVIGSRMQFRWPQPNEILVMTEGCMPKIDTEESSNGLGLVSGGMPMAPVGMTLIADEAHMFKNGSAGRTKKFINLVSYVRASNGRVWLLTGTPLLNRPPELWMLMSHAGVAEQCFGSYQSFVRAFRGARRSGGTNWGKPGEEVPDLLRKVMLRRNRVDVLKDLPRKQRVNKVVGDIDTATIAYLDGVVEKMAERGIDIDDIESLRANWTQAMPFEMMSRTMSLLATAMVPAMLIEVESYEEQGLPLVVFSTHRVPIDTLGARKGWATITGDTPADERGRIVEDFQAGKLKGIAGTYGAMGVGVTLTHAHHTLLVGAPWTPALISQAEDRTCRIGQTADSVQIIRLLCDHKLHERVVELLTEKQEIIENSVEAAGVEADYIGASPAAALASAAARAQELSVNLAERRAQLEARREAERAEQAAEVARNIPDYDGRELDIHGKFRSAGSPREDWAARALELVASDDPDRASALNGVGFSAHDGVFGHSLNDQLQRNGRLSEKQWVAAIRIANKYRRQVIGTLGPMPVK